MSNIITVSREFGSGGRELGKRLADELGSPILTREILEAIAEQTNTSEWYAQEVLERGMLPGYTLHFGHSFSYYSPVAQQAVNLMVAERKVIKGTGGETGLCDCRPGSQQDPGEGGTLQYFHLRGYGVQDGPLPGARAGG